MDLIYQSQAFRLKLGGVILHLTSLNDQSVTVNPALQELECQIRQGSPISAPAVASSNAALSRTERVIASAMAIPLHHSPCSTSERGQSTNLDRIAGNSYCDWMTRQVRIELD